MCWARVSCVYFGWEVGVRYVVGGVVCVERSFGGEWGV